MATVEFFYDIASPYTYLAATQVPALADRTGAEVRWRPFLLGGVFQATGNQPPATLPARARYLLTDLYRWARHYDVKFQFPPDFPTNTLYAMRALAALPESEQPAHAMRLFEAYWVHGRNPADTSVLVDVLGEELVRAAGTPEVKERLRANSDEAVKRGAFGAPTFFVGDQMWFGNDRLPLLEQYLTL